jgi:class 3 adenylate cyclase
LRARVGPRAKPETRLFRFSDRRNCPDRFRRAASRRIFPTLAFSSFRGEDHIYFVGENADDIADAIKEFLTGLHTGECEMIGDDVGGIAVHIVARVAALAGAGEVWVSSTVDLVAGSGLRFDDRGRQSLKGIPGQWRLFAAERQGTPRI